MKIVLGFLVVFFSQLLFSQSIVGAWEWSFEDKSGTPVRAVVIFAEEYQVAAFYRLDGTFKSTNGGTWSIEGNTITETVEFDSSNPERVGSSVSFDAIISKNVIVTDFGTMTRIDGGTPGALAGPWLMSGRKKDGVGEIQERDTSGPRKTMKMLSGTRFQWIAYNTETKEFLGTGGGTYTTLDGEYTENIEFFSRDETRVGASLAFNYDLVEGKWNHSGMSSKGEPIYEVWSIR
jgi:hypothetical protein